MCLPLPCLGVNNFEVIVPGRESGFAATATLHFAARSLTQSKVERDRALESKKRKIGVG